MKSVIFLMIRFHKIRYIVALVRNYCQSNLRHHAATLRRSRDCLAFQTQLRALGNGKMDEILPKLVTYRNHSVSARKSHDVGRHVTHTMADVP